MKVEDLVKRIQEWECEAGECFKDYFMHDNVKVLSWSFWLLGKGYTEHALELIKKLEAGETYFDQEELFDIYPEYVGEDQKFSEENCEKNVVIWSEFLLATKSYRERMEAFFKRDEES